MIETRVPSAVNCLRGALCYDVEHNVNRDLGLDCTEMYTPYKQLDAAALHGGQSDQTQAWKGSGRGQQPTVQRIPLWISG